MIVRVLGLIVCALVVGSGPSPGARAGQLLTIDHYVRVRSSVPSIAGQITQIYVRERAAEATLLRGSPAADRVVLFIHGAGTPAEVAFDVSYGDYSWMAHLADAGFDVFAMDQTGYGRSTRPLAMNDPCNLSKADQAAFTPPLAPASCTPSHPQPLTTIASDWDDIAAVVDYVRALRKVDRVSLIGWSLGGPRAGGFAARNPDKIHRLVLLAPAFNRTASSTPPAKPSQGAAMNKQTHEDFTANWTRQIGCADQYDPAVNDAVWSAMLASDPVGATWGLGVRRAPLTTVWGWNSDVVSKMQTPTLLVAAALDKQVTPERVRELHADLGSPQKVLVDLGCASHNAIWEKNHTLLFNASREWLLKGTVNGTASGTLRLGYPQ